MLYYVECYISSFKYNNCNMKYLINWEVYYTDINNY